MFSAKNCAKCWTLLEIYAWNEPQGSILFRYLDTPLAAKGPKNLKRKDFTLSETGKHPVIGLLRTVLLVVFLVYGIPQTPGVKGIETLWLLPNA